jgi:hypothetical protein
LSGRNLPSRQKPFPCQRCRCRASAKIAPQWFGEDGWERDLNDRMGSPIVAGSRPAPRPPPAHWKGASATEAIAPAGRRGRKVPGIPAALSLRRANPLVRSQWPSPPMSVARTRAHRASSGRRGRRAFDHCKTASGADQQKRAVLLHDLDNLTAIVIHSRRSSIPSVSSNTAASQMSRLTLADGRSQSPAGCDVGRRGELRYFVLREQAEL